jgi:hypothetical protein
MPQMIEPEISLSAFNCSHCGALAHQDWYSTAAKQLKAGTVPHIHGLKDIEECKEELSKKRPTDSDREMLAIIENLAKLDFELARFRQGEMFTHDTGNLHISQCY